MEGAPQRANSAQLAARNIKAAKPRRRPAGRLGSPTPQSSATAMASGGGSGGGLFGGSVQAAGTFEFSAPGSGLSFPPSGFATNNNPFAMNSLSSPDVSENESDPRADTTGEEAARAKRPFRGFGVPDDQPGNSLFQAPTQSNNPFGSLQVQEKSNSFPPFGSSTAQLQQPGFGFKVTAAPVQPSTNSFSFGQTSSQTSNIFGVANSLPQPSTSLFNFGQPASQPLQSIQPEQPKASNNAFNFGQSISQPVQPEQSKPSGGHFSFGQPASQTGQSAQAGQSKSLFNFGPPAATTQEKPTSKPAFAFGQTAQSQNPIFGVSQPTEAPASNLFGNSQPSTTPGSPNMFGSLSQKSAAPSNLFSNLNAAASPSSNFFGLQAKASAGVLNEADSQQSQQPAASGINVFSNSSQSSTMSNIFGQLNTQPSSTANLFGGQQQSESASSGLFGNFPQQPSPATASEETDKPTSTQDLFGHLNKPVESSSSTNTIFADVNGTATFEPRKDEVSSAKSVSQLFGQSPSANIFSSAAPLVSAFSAPEITHSSTVDRPTFSFGSAQPSVDNGNNVSSIKKPHFSSSADQSHSNSTHSFTAQPLQGVDKTTRLSSQSTSNNSTSADASSRVTLSGILKRIEQTDVAELAEMLPDMAEAASYPEEKMRLLIPESHSDEQKEQFYLTYRLRLLNQAMSAYFATAKPTAEVCPGMVFYVKMRELIVSRCPPSFRLRKGRRWLAKENQENLDPNGPIRAVKAPVAPQYQPLSRSSSSPTKSPPKAKSAQPLSNGKISSPAPILSSPSLAPIPSPSKQGKRKAENQLTKDDYERGEGKESRPLKTPRSFGASGGSNTSNIFKNILDSPEKSTPAKGSPEKKLMGMPQQSAEEAPRFNPFASLPVPTASKPATSAPTSVPTANIFTPKLQSGANSIFQSPTAQGSSNANDAANKTGAPIKAPEFGSAPVNFLAQFGQQASKCKEDSEKKLMEDSKAEDMDSDEDEAEWEAKYREKRKAELKEIEEIAKSKQASFQPGKGFTFGQIAKPAEDVGTTVNASSSDGGEIPAMPSEHKNAGNLPNAKIPKSIFGQNIAPQSNGNSIFSSLNASRTSSPAGSVFDGHKSGKPASLGANIFAHLSDADSGADSGKGNDGDDESTDEDSDAENDANKENTTQEPQKRATSGILTLAEGTTSAASSAKPAPSFSFGSGKFGGFGGASSASGTSSPGGSLFDRVTKDSNGNPVRQLSGEEKENTEPSTTSNIFGNINNPFGKASDPSADKTWKPDSPIKFGSATPKKDDSETPTVNVTAPTPTKPASPFSNLFGNNSTIKPASSLFSAPSSAGVGFNFGGPASTTSSLFPSAAGSASTSRATSPGLTTDGESAAESGDPDAEHHEQIDLTTGGPGEEDEEVLHEVRAKALKFVAKSEGDTSNPWETKGVGPLRVLKHKETSAIRILLRADPSGTIVLNKALLSQVNYESTGKTIKLLTAGESGKGLETWILQVKTPEVAASLAEVLQKHKPS